MSDKLKSWLGVKNKYLIYIWVGAFLVLVGMNLFYNRESFKYFGIAETREVAINFEYPVEIKRVNVVSGEKILAGRLLVELDQTKLKLRINDVSTRLASQLPNLN